MEIDEEFFKRIENRFPMPISTVVQKCRKMVFSSDSAQRLRQVLDLHEAILSYLTPIAIMGYLVYDGQNLGVNNRITEFVKPSVGHWEALLRDSLQAISKKARGEGFVRIENDPRTFLCDLSDIFFSKLAFSRENEGYKAVVNLQEYEPKFEKVNVSPTIQGLIEFLTKVRNEYAHGVSKDNPGYYDELSKNLFLIFREVLKGFETIILSVTLVHVNNVSLVKGEFIHHLNECMGLDVEPSRLICRDTGLNDHEVYILSRNKEVVGTDDVLWVLPLSPYFTVVHCPVCQQQKVFIYKGSKRNSVEYRSYSCGHEFVPDGHLGDFQDIKDFLKGKIPLKRLFEGKTIGATFEEDLLGLSAESIRSSEDFFTTSIEKVREGDLLLATKDLEAAIRLNPDYAEAYFNLALLHILLESDSAYIVDNLNKAVAIEPDNVQYLLATAKIFRFILDEKDTLTILGKVLRVDPSCQEAKVLLNEIIETLKTCDPATSTVGSVPGEGT